jgi:hypothetical protein
MSSDGNSFLSPQPPIAKDLETLLDFLSAEPPTIGLCKNCGSKMLHVDAIFFLSDGDRGWNIPLPVCPRCEDGVEGLVRQLSSLPLKAA